jgi:hypothetical protein
MVLMKLRSVLFDGGCWIASRSSDTSSQPGASPQYICTQPQPRQDLISSHASRQDIIPVPKLLRWVAGRRVEAHTSLHHLSVCTLRTTHEPTCPSTPGQTMHQRPLQQPHDRANPNSSCQPYASTGITASRALATLATPNPGNDVATHGHAYDIATVRPAVS